MTHLDADGAMSGLRIRNARIFDPVGVLEVRFSRLQKFAAVGRSRPAYERRSTARHALTRASGGPGPIVPRDRSVRCAWRNGAPNARSRVR